MGYKAQVIDLGESLEEAKEKGSEDGNLRRKKEELESEVKELKVRFHFSMLVNPSALIERIDFRGRTGSSENVSNLAQIR